MSRAKRGKAKKTTDASQNFNIIINKTDMNEDMQKNAVEVVRDAFSESKVQKVREGDRTQRDARRRVRGVQRPTAAAGGSPNRCVHRSR
jgi:tryptophan synthase beta subunit